MPRRETAFLDHLTPRWVPLLLMLCLGGCGTYYGQLARGQLELLRQREPVERILADPTRDAQLRERLALALQARAFASARLGLPDNGSYRVYADIGRPYVVWNVFATPEFSINPLTHCFPIAGCVAYRGYYRQGAARGAAALLGQQGYDTYVAGVEAYSTLGWFDDPLLSSMMSWDEDRLAALIFHELAHQQLYVPDDTAFNESFASFVEREGLRQWRASRGLPPRDEQAREQYAVLAELVLETRERLDRLYASGLPEAQMRQAKAEEFERLRRLYRERRDRQWGGVGRFDRWIEQPLNNARLLPFGLYDRWVPAFAGLFEQVDRDWPRFYVRVAELGQLPADEREAALEALR
ncbi:aminopeptidase [Stutzerimonas azotifigens]|uniref:Aminopeptidase n=1 Tax=Stutzerimonas azotifigens TaxID=291995 RepID=A0ABR5Z6J4_9GAMM|nr:aminopeptidase [Stutzerimonas azotifigens]MBA1275763.1 aminopeptidase [Stutzerimonas azotifigens]